ncbi:hypothetical protein MFS40622_0105 [Methanocaldococcus sp. FS406-22]|uniref:hypothetical protein n=1 Tax=Methanocaldococcus sp. (strain FS406-22) TaxID=644281 RepID=UPI0001BF1DC9|nr:hypothetical protein [Methanocaldococcus sp. FS406-22]ADC68805.1 hypothetical protein MFS40622_0105 [Methanocaldococcus sp. FS406-22]
MNLLPIYFGVVSWIIIFLTFSYMLNNPKVSYSILKSNKRIIIYTCLAYFIIQMGFCAIEGYVSFLAIVCCVIFTLILGYALNKCINKQYKTSMQSSERGISILAALDTIVSIIFDLIK